MIAETFKYVVKVISLKTFITITIVYLIYLYEI